MKSSGGSSAVERNPSKVGVEGSTPSPRSKKSAAVRKDVQGVGKLVASALDAAAMADQRAVGTQAPPADTTKRPRGRPRLAEPKSPRAEYQRELMRKRYAKKKAQEAKP